MPNIRLPINLSGCLILLDQIQILNYIEEKALAAAPEEQAAFADILTWAKEKRNTLCQEGPHDDSLYFF